MFSLSTYQSLVSLAANATTTTGGGQLNTYQGNRFVVPPKIILSGFRAPWNWMRTIVLQKSRGGGQGDTKLTPTHCVYLRLHSQPPSKCQRLPSTLNLLLSTPGYVFNGICHSIFIIWTGTDGLHFPWIEIFILKHKSFGNYACARTDITPRKPQHMS